MPTRAASPGESYWTYSDVAKLVGKSRRWVQDRATSGEITSFKIGRDRLFEPEKVKAWFEQMKERK